ncbi:MAG: MAPEG family protein [Alphaproteobacteria bacterium]|nr:MAPEG family protein [Alphaproteobacteria bacterium]
MNPLVLTLIAAFAVTVLSKIPVSKAQKETGRYDNNNPRAQQKALTGWGARALAAHQNAYENFPIFGVGIAVALATDADPTVGAALGWTYVGARVLYNILYLADQGILRSAMWSVGLLATLGLYVIALLA